MSAERKTKGKKLKKEWHVNQSELTRGESKEEIKGRKKRREKGRKEGRKG